MQFVEYAVCQRQDGGEDQSGSLTAAEDTNTLQPVSLFMVQLQQLVKNKQ
jgi:hypothetical protein